MNMKKNAMSQNILPNTISTLMSNSTFFKFIQLRKHFSPFASIFTQKSASKENL